MIFAKKCQREDNKKRNFGVIHPNARHVSFQFYWSDEERINFFSNKMKELAQNLKLREGAKEIYLISHRVFPNYRQPCKTAKD